MNEFPDYEKVVEASNRQRMVTPKSKRELIELVDIALSDTELFVECEDPNDTHWEAECSVCNGTYFVQVWPKD